MQERLEEVASGALDGLSANDLAPVVDELLGALRALAGVLFPSATANAAAAPDPVQGSQGFGGPLPLADLGLRAAVAALGQGSGAAALGGGAASAAAAAAAGLLCSAKGASFGAGGMPESGLALSPRSLLWAALPVVLAAAAASVQGGGLGLGLGLHAPAPPVSPMPLQAAHPAAPVRRNHARIYAPRAAYRAVMLQEDVRMAPAPGLVHEVAWGAESPADGAGGGAAGGVELALRARGLAVSANMALFTAATTNAVTTAVNVNAQLAGVLPPLQAAADDARRLAAVLNPASDPTPEAAGAAAALRSSLGSVEAAAGSADLTALVGELRSAAEGLRSARGHQEATALVAELEAAVAALQDAAAAVDLSALQRGSPALAPVPSGDGAADVGAVAALLQAVRPEVIAAGASGGAGAGASAEPSAETDGAGRGAVGNGRALIGPAGGPTQNSLQAAAAGLDRAAMRLKDALAALEAAERAAPPLRDR